MTSAPIAAPGHLPKGKSDVLDEVYGTGNEVKDTVAEIHQYSSEADSGGDFDPLEKLISKGLGFVIDYITPVKEALEMVTGSPDALNSAAQNYNKISDETNKLGQELHDQLKTGFSNWEGDASQAAHQQMATFLDGVHGTAQLAAQISEVLQASAVLMKAAKDIIIGIIADFVEQMLITWAIGLAGSVLTLGASDAAATAATVAEAGTSIARAGEEVSKVTRLIEKVGKIIQKILKVIEKIAKRLEEIGGKISKFGGKIGQIAEKVAGKGGKIGEMVGGKLGEVGSKVGEYGEHLGEGGEDLGKVVDAAKTGDKAGLKSALKDTMENTGKIKGDFDEVHDKFGEYKQKVEDFTGTGGGNSDQNQNSGGHWTTPEHHSAGDILKENAKAAGKDVWNNEKEIFKEGASAGAYTTQSNSDINNELGVNSGGHGQTYATKQDKGTLGQQVDQEYNRPLT